MPVGLAKQFLKNQILFGSKSSKQYLSSVSYYSKGRACKLCI